MGEQVFSHSGASFSETGWRCAINRGAKLWFLLEAGTEAKAERRADAVVNALNSVGEWGQAIEKAGRVAKMLNDPAW